MVAQRMLTEVFDDENVGDVLKIAAAVVENLVGEVGASEGKPVLRSLELRLGLGSVDCDKLTSVRLGEGQAR